MQLVLAWTSYKTYYTFVCFGTRLENCASMSRELFAPRVSWILLAYMRICRPMLYLILQIMKEIREEHDRLSDHSTTLTSVHLETLASCSVDTDTELMQVNLRVSISSSFIAYNNLVFS